MLYWILFVKFTVPFDYQRNARYPDFKHKETGEGLWLESSPSWVLPKLPPLKPKQAETGKTQTPVKWAPKAQS